MVSSAVRIVFRCLIKQSSLLLSLLYLITFVGCDSTKKEDTIPFYNSAEFTAEWINQQDPKYTEIHKIGPFSLLDQNAEVVSNATLKGKIYIANFFFSVCPSICPKMTINLQKIQDEFRDDPEVHIVSHSVMPWVDTTDILYEYAMEHNIDHKKWQLLTGEKEQIYDLARNSYFAEKGIGLQKSSDEFLHTENFLLIDGMGRIRGVFNGTLPLETERIIETIYALKKDA